MLGVSVIDLCILETDACEIDGVRYAVKRGSWAFYIPDLQLKLLHAVDDRVHCVHPTAPDRDSLFNRTAEIAGDRYTIDDWIAAFSKTAVRRAAENCVAARRLFRAGLGPELLGIAVVRRYRSHYSGTPCRTAGIRVADLRAYAPKPDATEADLLACGVRPDRIRSCLRQQINGYVSDLNSVVGVMPEDAEREIAMIAKRLEDAAAEPPHSRCNHAS